MKKKYNQCYDVSEKNVRYLNLSIKRSKGQLPDMEVAKAYSKIISKIKLINNFSILDVGCLTGHFYRTFKNIRYYFLQICHLVQHGVIKQLQQTACSNRGICDRSTGINYYDRNCYFR